jgi:hypothetical protein
MTRTGDKDSLLIHVAASWLPDLSESQRVRLDLQLLIMPEATMLFCGVSGKTKNNDFDRSNDVGDFHLMRNICVGQTPTPCNM